MLSFSTENHRTLWTEIIESTRSISSFGHFHRIQILFLLPIVFSLMVYPSFHLALFHPEYDFISFAQLEFSHFFLMSTFEIIVPILYALFLSNFFLHGVITTTTYSAVQELLHVGHINLVSSIKSIVNSFFPLLFTSLISQTIFISVALLFALMLEFVVQSVQSLGLTELKCDSNHLFWVIPVLIVLVTFLLWLQVNWSLTYLIPTVELEKVLLLRHAPKEKVFATKVTGGYKTLRRWCGCSKGCNVD
ncbi:hypothetical protein P3L10_030944 [Capsicum annuum]